MKRKYVKKRRERRRWRTGALIMASLLAASMFGGCGSSLAGIRDGLQKAGEKVTGKKKDKQEGAKTAKAVEKSAVGILYTKDSKGDSVVSWLDKSLKKRGESSYDFSAAYYDGFRNMCGADGLIYLFPRGDYIQKNAKELVVIDETDGSCETVDVGLSNVTGYAVEGDTLCFSSNENHAGKVSVVDLQTRKVKSMDIKPADGSGALVFDVALSNGEIYGMALDDQLKVSLAKLDVEAGSYEKILDLPDADTPGFLPVNGRELLFISEGQLARFDPDKRELTKTPLTDVSSLRQAPEGKPADAVLVEPFNLNLSGDRLLIGYTDVFGGEEQTSLVEVRDVQTLEVIASAKVKGAIMQLEMSGDDLYVLGYSKLTKYALKKAGAESEEAAPASGQRPEKFELNEVKAVKTERKGYDVGGLFIIRGGGDYGGMSEEEAVKLNDRMFDEVDISQIPE